MYLTKRHALLIPATRYICHVALNYIYISKPSHCHVGHGIFIHDFALRISASSRGVCFLTGRTFIRPDIPAGPSIHNLLLRRAHYSSHSWGPIGINCTLRAIICTNYILRSSHCVGHGIFIRDIPLSTPASFHGVDVPSLDALASGQTFLLVQAFTGSCYFGRTSRSHGIWVRDTALRTPASFIGFMFPYRTYLHQARHSGCLEHSQVLVTSGVLASQSMRSALSVPEALLASTVHYVRFILLPSCYVERKLA